jgi:hypothetical protein
MGGSPREQILAAIDRSSPGSGHTFRIGEILHELSATADQTFAENTLRTQRTSRLPGDAPDRSGNHQRHLERVDRGIRAVSAIER